MDFRTICINYGRLLAEIGNEDFVDDDRVFFLDELVYTFEQHNGKWTPVGLGYKLFGFNSVLLETGEGVYISEEVDENGEEEFYEVTDENILKKHKEFLIWRLKALKELNI